MKRFLISIMLALVSVAALPGCVAQSTSATTRPAVDPIALAADQATVVIQALNIVRSTVDANGKPVISDADWASTYLPAIHIVQNTLLAWQSAPAGTSDAQKAESAFLASLPDILNLVASAQHKSHPSVPTSRPVN